MPEVWRMMNAIFSALHSDAATIRSPSPSRSSSSVTTTSSPLAKACRTSWIGSAIEDLSLCGGALAGLASARQHHYAGQDGADDAAGTSHVAGQAGRKFVDGRRVQSPWSRSQEK